MLKSASFHVRVLITMGRNDIASFFFFHNKTALENKRKQLISHAIFIYLFFFFATLLYQVALSKDDLLTLIKAVHTQTDSRDLFTELDAGKSRFCLFGSLDFHVISIYNLSYFNVLKICRNEILILNSINLENDIIN